ncbi:hypothetical protein HDU86_005027 [Geranomyces michiganensis]|nr:hypothetical protein HDU86_005027 [Geranomyces michiganensis]
MYIRLTTLPKGPMGRGKEWCLGKVGIQVRHKGGAHMDVKLKDGREVKWQGKANVQVITVAEYVADTA